jgi:hypothetical protein
MGYGPVNKYLPPAAPRRRGETCLVRQRIAGRAQSHRWPIGCSPADKTLTR